MASRLLDLKAFGERIASRDRGRQTAEVQIRVARMTRFKELGTAEIEREREKGASGQYRTDATPPRKWPFW